MSAGIDYVFILLCFADCFLSYLEKNRERGRVLTSLTFRNPPIHCPGGMIWPNVNNVNTRPYFLPALFPMSIDVVSSFMRNSDLLPENWSIQSESIS